MDKRSTMAKKLFEQGHNCAQAVLLPFCEELGLDKDIALRLASSFGGGMGRLKEVCGALTAAFMVIGFKKGYTYPVASEEKEKYYLKIQSFAEKFREEYGSILCKDLRDWSGEIPHQCATIVEYAAKMLEKDIISPFEEHCIAYDAWFDRHPNKYASELIAIKQFIPSGKGGVEIGVGTGRFASPLGISVGVEPSAGMAQLARERGIKVIEGLAEALPLASNTYDFVLSVTSICFFSNPNVALQEIYRIIKPKGYLVIAFVDKDSKLGKQYQERKVAGHTFYNTASFYSVKEVVDMLTSAGFKDCEIKQTLVSCQDVPEQPQEGYGKGSFIVIRAYKG